MLSPVIQAVICFQSVPAPTAAGHQVGGVEPEDVAFGSCRYLADSLSIGSGQVGRLSRPLLAETQPPAAALACSLAQSAVAR